jgi:hypothetical protein
VLGRTLAGREHLRNFGLAGCWRGGSVAGH